MSKMTPQKWRVFRVWFAATAALMVWALWLFGVFENAPTGVLIITGLALGAIAIASYFYWIDLPEDMG